MGTHRFALVVALLVAGCGDDSPSGSVDGGDGDGGGGGDGGGSDVFNMIPCDYNESMDATNYMPANAEASGVTLAGSRVVLCGNLDTGHYGINGGADMVDADGIKFTAPAGQVIVHLIGGTGFTTNVDWTAFYLQRGGSLYGFGVVEGDHGTLTFNLTAGEYFVAVYAINDAATSAAIPYKVLISPDTARCATKVGTADFPEAGDGGSNTGNDMIEFNATANNQSSLTSSTSDMPEATNFTVDPGESFLITGDSANVDVVGDDYMDRDTYHFTTGPTTTQMSVRLNWTSTMTDLDYRIYPPRQSGIPVSFVGGLKISDMEDEYETFSVQPNTSYWLWVAAEDGATVPAAYSATLCGETFTP